MSRPSVSVAPMMALTDRHFRYLARTLSPSALLYSEMVTAKAVLHGDRERLLAKDPDEGDVVLQLGGDDPDELAESAAIGTEFGYVEINLNVGCPSERVASGNFGACLMAQPELVGSSLAAMKSATTLPVSVKHRIGIDHADAYADLERFVDIVETVSGSAPSAYVVHARKAWLKGLSPKENRTVPPLRYSDVHRLKRARPHLLVDINGGIASVDDVRTQLRLVDGVMIGRAAYEDPGLLARLEPLLSRREWRPTGREVVERMTSYAESRLALGDPLAAVTRHLLNLFKGAPRARAWRRILTEGAHLPGAGPELIMRALSELPSEVVDTPIGVTMTARPSHSGQVGAGTRRSGLWSGAERAQVLPGDDEVLDLVGAFADTR